MSLDHHLAFPQRIGRQRLRPFVWSCSLCSNNSKHSKHASPPLKLDSTSTRATPRVLHPVTHQVLRPVLLKHHLGATGAHKVVMPVTIASCSRPTKSPSSWSIRRVRVHTVCTPCLMRYPSLARSSVSRSGNSRRLNRPSPNTSSRPSPVPTARKRCGRSVRQRYHRGALEHTSQHSLHCCMVATA